MTERRPSKKKDLASRLSSGDKADVRKAKARRVKSEMGFKSVKEDEEDSARTSYYRRYMSEIGEDRRKQYAILYFVDAVWS